MESLVFIISPPRSGSTLLQRLLGSHESVAIFSEISLLLRFLGGPGEVIRYADYRESNLEIAKNDIRKVWLEFDQIYLDQIRALMQSTYKGLANGKMVFVDKTPRYTLIAEEIYKCFPDAKFLVLWRHPLAIAASVSETFFDNRWVFDDFMIDLTRGLDRLNVFDFPDRERVFSLCYEDLVQSPRTLLSQIGKFLNLPDLPSVLERPLIKTNRGTLGDPSGIDKYEYVSADSLYGWKAQYNSFYRQKWARNYYNGQRKEWLEKRGYCLPGSFESYPLHKNIYYSVKEWNYQKRTTKKKLRSVSEVFKKYHISGSSLGSLRQF